MKDFVFRSDDSRLLKRLDAMSRIDRKALAADLGATLVGRIKDRVARGEDVHGKRLEPSKRAQRDRGQTLVDTGAMLMDLGTRRVNEHGCTVGFGSVIEAKKAIWANKGTRAHLITAKTTKALMFETSAATGRGTAYAFAPHVHHPGTPKRTFFGISMGDRKALQAVGLSHLVRAAEGKL